MRSVFRVTILLAALCSSNFAAAQIYKWVDAKGVTHYESSPQGSKPQGATTLAIPVTTADSSADGGASWQEKSDAFNARYDKKKAEQAKQDKKDAQTAAAKQQKCAQARDQLRILDETHRIYTLDAQGNRIYMNDAQYDQHLADMRAAAAANC